MTYEELLDAWREAEAAYAEALFSGYGAEVEVARHRVLVLDAQLCDAELALA